MSIHSNPCHRNFGHTISAIGKKTPDIRSFSHKSRFLPLGYFRKETIIMITELQHRPHIWNQEEIVIECLVRLWWPVRPRRLRWSCSLSWRCYISSASWYCHERILPVDFDDNYDIPQEQKWLIGIIFMVPVYTVSSVMYSLQFFHDFGNASCRIHEMPCLVFYLCSRTFASPENSEQRQSLLISLTLQCFEVVKGI